MRSFIVALLLSGVAWNCYGQTALPIKWQISSISVSDSEVQLIFTASLKEGWHIYSQSIGEGGPLPTTFSFTSSEIYSRIGVVEEFGTPVKVYDSTFMMDITWFSDIIVFKQKIALHQPSAIVNGKIEFMVCTDETCLPPNTQSFSLAVKAKTPARKASKLNQRSKHSNR